ncbi:MAG: histidinol-phosphate transaminase [Candidatus Dormibacteraeota bacterium]|nr:histidinol-phosphate transaminase [Candidatus Dormibacteraeota bacterium]
MPSRFLKPSLRGFQPYQPGQQPPDGEHWVKLNTNESPYPPSPRVLEALRNGIDDSLRLYPPPMADPAAAALAAAHGLEPDWVRLGNGEDELLAMCMRAFAAAGTSVAFTWPTYPLLEPLCGIHELTPVRHPLGAGWCLPDSLASDPSPLKFLVNPNSPTGTWYRREEIQSVVEASTGVVVLDEAYVDFAPESRLDLLAEHDNLLILRTMSKSYALAGMRIGFALGNPDLLSALDTVKDSYNLDRLGVIAARAAAEDLPYRDELVARIIADREWFSAELKAIDFEVSRSSANFVFARPPAGIRADGLAERLRASRILVRHFTQPPLDGWLRVTVGTREQLHQVLGVIMEAMQEQ